MKKRLKRAVVASLDLTDVIWDFSPVEALDLVAELDEQAEALEAQAGAIRAIATGIRSAATVPTEIAMELACGLTQEEED